MSAIKLSGDCSIYEISSIHQQVMKHWKGHTALALDLSSVIDIDASFIQLLMSCKQTAEQNNQTFELLNVSDPLSKMIDGMFSSDFFTTPSNLAAITQPAQTGA